MRNSSASAKPRATAPGACAAADPAITRPWGGGSAAASATTRSRVPDPDQIAGRNRVTSVETRGHDAQRRSPPHRARRGNLGNDLSRDDYLVTTEWLPQGY